MIRVANNPKVQQDVRFATVDLSGKNIRGIFRAIEEHIRGGKAVIVGVYFNDRGSGHWTTVEEMSPDGKTLVMADGEIFEIHIDESTSGGGSNGAENIFTKCIWIAERK